jgi:hypothetical protein
MSLIARSPLLRQTNLLRTRLAGPVRFSHGDYHVCFFFSLGFHNFYMSISSALSIRDAREKESAIRPEALSLSGHGLQHSIPCLVVPAVSSLVWFDVLTNLISYPGRRLLAVDVQKSFGVSKQ